MASAAWLDHYAILELYDPINQTGSGPNATPEAIKQAWKLQLSAWHPDKFRGDARPKAEERTKLINGAHEVLSDPKAKQAYDVEWMRKNSWFRQERESKSSALPEIAVRWDPPDALSNVFYNIPPGEKRRATLIIAPRGRRGLWVEIEEPTSGWIRVIEPKNRRGMPEFTAVIEVDTADLQPEQFYNSKLLFRIDAGKMAERIIHPEDIRVRVGPQSPVPQPDVAHASARSRAYWLWGLVGIALFIGFVLISVGSFYRSGSQQPVQQVVPTATREPQQPAQRVAQVVPIATHEPERPVQQAELTNIASRKPITIQAKGNERQENIVNNINDGNLDSASGWVNDDYNQEMVVEVTIDLQGTYDISKIRYTVGNVMRDSTWTADLMETPFGQISPIPGRQNWTEQTGHVTESQVKLVFYKTRTAWERDWLFIGEIEIYGIPVTSEPIVMATATQAPQQPAQQVTQIVPTATRGPTSTPTPIPIFIPAPQQSSSCIQPPYGLVSWWSGDGNADDIIGKNNGKLVGGVKFTDGMVGQAFHFDGMNDIVMATATGLPAGAAPRTVAFWAKTDPAANNATGFGYGDEAIGKGFYIFPANSANGGRLTFSSNGPSGIVASYNLRDGQYHYIVVTYDGSTATVYADGVTVTARNLSLDTGTSEGACIGGRCYLGEFFLGDVDEVTIWDRALSASEIEVIFKASSAGMCKLKELTQVK